jgi:hypothetical protein
MLKQLKMGNNEQQSVGAGAGAARKPTEEAKKSQVQQPANKNTFYNNKPQAQ